MHPVNKSEIQKFVREFLDSNTSIILETKLRRVDPLIESISRIIDKRIKKKSDSNPAKAVKFIDKPQSLNSKLKKISRNESCHDGPINVDISNVNPWKILETYQIIKATETLGAEKEKDALDRKAMIQDLNDQVNAKKNAEQLAILEDEKFNKDRALELHNWRKCQDQALANKKEKISYLKNIRQMQIAQLDEKRKKEKNEQREQELKEIKEAEAEMKRMKMKSILKRQQERSRWEKIKLEDAEREKKKRELERKEKELDIKQMEDYKTMQELEDKRRQQVARTREAKCQLRVAKCLNDDKGELRKAKEKRELIEMKIINDYQARERKNLERETKDKEARETQIKEITEYNKKAADEKRLKKLSIEKEEREYNTKLSKDREAGMLAEEEALRLKKMREEKSYCKLLDEQVSAQNLRRVNMENMTDVEKSVNRKVRHNAFLTIFL